MNRVLLIAAAAACAATPLAAQHAHPTPTRSRPSASPAAQPAAAGQMTADCQMQAMMMPLHHLAAFRPDTLLLQARALRLDADQEAQLARLATAGRAARDSLRAAAMAHGAQLQAALDADAPDQVAITGHFEAMHAAMGAAHVAALRDALSARALLTAGQRSLVAPAHQGMMHQSPGAHGAGGMCM